MKTSQPRGATEMDAEPDAPSGPAAEDTKKIAVVLQADLEPWQRLNVTAFLISGVAAQPHVVGERYLDASGNTYLPMLKDPVLVFGADSSEISRTIERGRSRQIEFSTFTRDLFNTFNDE